MISQRQSVSRKAGATGARGLGFQQVIDHINAVYRRLGMAFITRKAIPGKYITSPVNRRFHGANAVTVNATTVPPLADLPTGTTIPAAVFRQFLSGRSSSAQRIFIPESRAEPDYGGVVAPDGRAISYDAKSTRRERLDFDNLHPHQIDFLESMAACGAIAGFLVEFTVHQSVFFVPVQLVSMVYAINGCRNIPYQLCAHQLVPVSPGRGGIIWDYLTAILEQEKRYGTTYNHLQVSFPVRRPARRQPPSDVSPDVRQERGGGLT